MALGEIDGTLLQHTAELLDEREELRAQVQDQPENTRLRAALGHLDRQLVGNLAHLGFTPSDRARLGLVRVKQQSKLEQMMAARHSRDEQMAAENHEQEKATILTREKEGWASGCPV